METLLIYSVNVNGQKTLINGVIEIKDKRKTYKFIGKNGTILAIIPKEICSLILLVGQL